MADDIVTRLRDYLAIVDHAFVWNELSDAADEIERLRADRDRWRGIAHALTFVPWDPAYLDGLDAYEQAVRGDA